MYSKKNIWRGLFFEDPDPDPVIYRSRIRHTLFVMNTLLNKETETVQYYINVHNNPNQIFRIQWKLSSYIGLFDCVDGSVWYWNWYFN